MIEDGHVPSVQQSTWLQPAETVHGSGLPVAKEMTMKLAELPEELLARIRSYRYG
jgi:hypothetical protein